jgi:hypothetical protein
MARITEGKFMLFFVMQSQFLYRAFIAHLGLDRTLHRPCAGGGSNVG